MGKYVKNIKVAKNLSKCLPAVMDVLYLIMLHINGNVDNVLSIIGENQVSPKTFQTDGHMDISNYRVASLLKMVDST